MKSCSTNGCSNEHRARGFCSACYNRERKAGRLELVLPRTDGTCPRCKERQRGVGQPHCKECHRDEVREYYHRHAERLNRERKSKYDPAKQRSARLEKQWKLSASAYERLLRDQGGRCAICREHGELHVDHDHACCPSKAGCCGKCVRGLLCGNCNNGLGRFKDDIMRLSMAIHYMTRKRVQGLDAEKAP